VSQKRLRPRQFASRVRIIKTWSMESKPRNRKEWRDFARLTREHGDGRTRNG
jgi:hypothetical protein